ncbi:MAG: FkbM family methyltransferase [Bryobacterales bacterium]|nr:FkbM family methyltransferase [Bryobacterales bacterium]
MFRDKLSYFYDRACWNLEVCVSLVKHTARELLRILRREPPVVAEDFDINTLPSLLGKPDPVILEIGCNDGSETLRFAELLPSAMIYAFEPDPRALQAFKDRVRSERVKLFAMAICDVDGSRQFHVSSGRPSPAVDVPLSGWDKSGSLRKPKEHLRVHPWCTFADTIMVETKRLDTWCSEEGVSSIDFIWADVQGAEVDLIQGGRSALARTRYLYTEYNNRELYEGQADLHTLQKLLPEFDLVFRFSNDALFKNRLLY